MFDPDYRSTGWNKSRYAPKNYGGSRKGRKATPMTDLARMVGATVGLATYFGLSSLKLESITPMTAIGSSFVTGFIIFILVGSWIFRREKRYIESLSEDKNEKNADLKTPKLQNYQYHSMTPDEFEEHVAWVITNSTPYSAKRVGGSGDGGIDVEVFKGHRRVGIIQCKRYEPTKSLPPSFIRELATVRAMADVETAYLVTNAKFSKQSRETAKTLGIRLIDGEKLKQIDTKLKQ